MLMKSNGDSSLFSLLSRKSMIDPQSILKISHRNRFYKCSNEVSTQSIPLTNDEQTQISNSNQSKDLQISPNKFHFVNPFALIDRVEHGEIFLKFVHKQNSKIDAIFSQFLQSLQKTADDFLLALQQENSLYGIYRRDLIWYITVLQDFINDQRIKVKILQEANRNFVLFQKHFHRVSRCKWPLQDFLDKQEKNRQQTSEHDQSVKLHKIQEQFWKIYRTSSVQLRAIEQQRLLAVREQMRLTVNLTLNNKDDNKLFTSNNLDQILNEWDEQHLISIDHWSQFPRRSLISRYDSSINLLDEIKQVIDECFYQRQTQPEALLRKDSTVSDGTVSHI